MIACAALQRLERYGSLGLKRHSTEDFVSTSLKDARRANIYALTLLSTWKEALQAVRGGNVKGVEDVSNAPVRYTDALVYAVSFAVALTTQHLFEVSTATAACLIFTNAYAQALELLTLLKEVTVAIGSGRALRSNASSDDFTKAVAHLLTSSTDLALLLLGGVSTSSDTATQEVQESQPGTSGTEQQQQQQQREAILAQALVLVAATAQMLQRVQASYPVSDLYHTRPCAALLKTVANKHKQLQQRLKHASGSSDAATEQARRTAQKKACSGAAKGTTVHQATATRAPALLDVLRRYIQLCARRSISATPQESGAAPSASASAASLFSIFSLSQRLGMLHGALDAVKALPKGLAAQLCGACEDVQYWLSQLLSSTACNRATRYVVYFREDELRLIQHNVRQASEYALYTFATTPPVDPGLVEPLLKDGVAADSNDDVMHARAALVLAQWCVSAPFFFESFCQGESWASFAQEQRRLVLLQQSRARRGLERESRRQQRKARAKQKAMHLDEEHSSRSSSVSCGSSDAASVHSSGSDSASSAGDRQQRQRQRQRGNGSSGDETASLLSLQTASHVGHAGGSVCGSVTSLASRVSLLSTLSKHSAASYLSFISVLQPSITAGSAAGGVGAGGSADGDGEAGADRQMHESEDGNTNLPLILLEQLALSLHRFMEAYPAELLDRYGLRSVSWSSIARMFATVEKSLVNTTALTAAAAQRQTNRFHSDQEPQQPLFNLAQDIRYNKGMGYECLGLLFAKVVAPLLDPTSSRVITSTPWSPTQPHRLRRSTGETRESDEDDSGGAHSDGERTEEGFFANAAAAAATVGRAVLTIDDDPATRAAVEAALSRCLTAYETVAPQVVDMNLPTILRLAARTAATSAGSTTSLRVSPTLSSLSIVLVDFVRDVTARLGCGNDLPHLVDALLRRGDFAANASAASAASAVVDSSGDTASAIRSLRAVFSLPPVRQAVMEAAGTSLDPESLLRRLSGIAAELEEDGKGSNSRRAHDEEEGDMPSTARPCWEDDDARVQRTLLALELMEALLAGVTPTCVSASAVLEQTTQLELLLSSSFMAAVEETKYSYGDALNDRRLLMIQHMYTIRQCRAVTIFCLQDLGTQQVHDYLRMLEDALWQLTSHVGNLVGSLTLAELLPLLRPHPARYGGSDVLASSSSVLEEMQVQLLPSSLILQRLSLARAVTVALGTHAGPAEELRDMVSHLWDCLGQDGHDADEATTPPQRPSGGVSLWLANQMTADEWVSLVALGKEKHARSSMMALLLRSAALTAAETTETPAWMSRCLQCIPGTVLRALVDAFVSLSVEDLCAASLAKASSPSARRQLKLAQRQWMALTTSLVAAYAVVGHNPYWPSVVAHTVRSVTHVSRAWQKHANERLGSAVETSAQAPPHSTAAHIFALLTQQLISLLLCTLRSEPRAAEVLRRVLLTLARESAVPSSSAAGPSVPVLSRSGMSVAYVEALKVPAASLSDLSAPAMLTASDPTTAADGGGSAEVVAALKDLTFEDEVRDVCTQLFTASFVKRIFTVTDLCSDSAAAAMSLPLATTTAAIRASMMTLALLYQVCVATAQASWRAKATDGSLEALVQTPAVVFLHTVASSFHARGAARAPKNGASSDATVDVVLAPFLEQFRAHDAEHSEQYLFVHIASAATAGEKRRRTRDRTDTDAGDTDRAAGDAVPLRTAIVAPSSALETVEELWRGQLRSAACTVMRLSDAAESEPDSCAPALQRACLTFHQLFACMWSSAHFRKHQVSKGAGNCTGGGGGDSKRARSNGDSEPTAHQSGLAGDVDAFLAAVLGDPRAPGDGSRDAVRRVTGSELRYQLADFFGVTATATGGAARVVERSRYPCDRMWMRLSSVGGEAGVCALWLLWKLQCVSAALTDRPATVDGVQDDSQTRMRTFLCAYYDLNASLTGGAATAATTTTTTAYTRVVTALRASPETLRVLPAEEAPPLLHEHVHDLLTRTIPGASPRASAVASSFALAAPAAAELIVHLFSVRPRLPGGQLLPHAQRLLVWLSHPSSAAASLAEAGVHGGAGLSLSSLCIRVCAAVAAHPAVSSASYSSAQIATWASPLPLKQQQLDACRGGRRLYNGSSAAQELLDNVWLLLLSLLEGSRAPQRATVAAPSVPLLREGEVVQLILLLTKTWLGHSARQQVLWSRPAMLPPLMCALFTCVMRGMESQQFSPRVLNVLASGLAAMAAHVGAATAKEGDAEVDSVDGDDDDDEGVGERKAEESASSAPATRSDERRRTQKRRLEVGTEASATGTAIPAHVKRAALAATTSALFEVAHHYIHIFTAFSSDMDFLFTDFLKVLSQHFLPTVTRPPIAHRVGVRIGGTVRSDMTFADLAYMCVGNAESKSLLRQAALRMEEEGLMDSGSAGGGIAGEGERGPALTDGSRSIFQVA